MEDDNDGPNETEGRVYPPQQQQQQQISARGENRTVRTLYACVAEHETELSFEPNQIITKGALWHCLESFLALLIQVIFAVRPSQEPGWLEGVLDGKYGLVPENYVEYIT